MSFPPRFSVLTFNLWNTEKWEEREEVLASFLTTYDPDILCFQEVRSRTLAAIDGMLGGHLRVRDPLRGWSEEGTVYFRKSLLHEMEYGAVDLSMPEADRRLFWVRLGVEGTEKTILVCTVHLTHQENVDEMATGLSYRHAQAHAIVRAMPQLAGEGEAVLVCGDFNDPIHPARILSGIGFREVFNSLGLVQPVTFPCRPISEEIHVTEAIDKIMARGPLVPLLAAVPQYYAHGKCASDHWPVLAVYGLR